MNILPRIRTKDLQSLSLNRNVSEAVSAAGLPVGPSAHRRIAASVGTRSGLGPGKILPLPRHFWPATRAIFHTLKSYVSREFCEMVKIVLDRSRFNRIISHTRNSKGYWIIGKQRRGRCVVHLHLSFPRITRRRSSRRAIRRFSCFARHPCLPEPCPLRFAPLVLRNWRGALF
jgi:hypothetical protein